MPYLYIALTLAPVEPVGKKEALQEALHGLSY